MVINNTTLQGIFVGFNTRFNKALAESAPLYPRVATVVPSVTEAETYAWLGDIPGMREWIGEREIHNLSGSGYTIRNKKFELTLSVSRDAIEDDRIGLYVPQVDMLAQSAAMHPDKLCFDLLKKGFVQKCYDGVPFFSAEHAVGKKKVSNKSNKALSVESYVAARAAILSMVNSKNQALHIVPDLLVVPPALEARARDILVADYIGGTRNTMAGTAEVLVAPALSGADTQWYLLATKRPIKPILYQERQKPRFVSKTNEQDEHVFMEGSYLYGVDARGNAGYGFWQMAFGSTGMEA